MPLDPNSSSPDLALKSGAAVTITGAFGAPDRLITTRLWRSLPATRHCLNFGMSGCQRHSTSSVARRCGRSTSSFGFGVRRYHCETGNSDFDCISRVCRLGAIDAVSSPMGAHDQRDRDSCLVERGRGRPHRGAVRDALAGVAAVADRIGRTISVPNPRPAVQIRAWSCVRSGRYFLGVIDCYRTRVRCPFRESSTSTHRTPPRRLARKAIRGT